MFALPSFPFTPLTDIQHRPNLPSPPIEVPQKYHTYLIYGMEKVEVLVKNCGRKQGNLKKNIGYFGEDFELFRYYSKDCYIKPHYVRI